MAKRHSRQSLLPCFRRRNPPSAAIVPVPHATLLKFGYPHSVVAEFKHWVVLLRPQQVTLAALVLASKSEAASLSLLPPEAFAEMHAAVQAIETALRSFRPFDKINYLALMMVDPHVHFHVLPRYASEQIFGGVAFRDAGWPGVPDLKQVNPCPESVMIDLRQALMDAIGKAR
jgi:diadenosine tetraphosphate (Ap4A) HIT family hydrolase